MAALEAGARMLTRRQTFTEGEQQYPSSSDVFYCGVKNLGIFGVSDFVPDCLSWCGRSLEALSFSPRPKPNGLLEFLCPSCLLGVRCGKDFSLWTPPHSNMGVSSLICIEPKLSGPGSTFSVHYVCVSMRSF